MNFDYSPFHPIIWGVFIAVWVVIYFMGNAYRKKMPSQPKGAARRIKEKEQVPTGYPET